jgi:CheY-like chemotaxis protein
VKKILVVDDQPAIRELLTDFLEDKKYFVKEAVDGWDALRKLDYNSFDLIITDIRMPGMNGLDLISELRNLKVNTKIIGMSGNSSCSRPDILAADMNKLDSDAFLKKPFELQHLYKVIEQLLESPKS